MQYSYILTDPLPLNLLPYIHLPLATNAMLACFTRRLQVDFVARLSNVLILANLPISHFLKNFPLPKNVMAVRQRGSPWTIIL